MRDQSGWVDGQGAARGDARLRPRYSVPDVARLLRRELVLMFVVFAAVLLLGVVVAATLPKTYTAHSSLLVNLSQQYVYEPVTGDAGRGIAPQKDQVVQSEAEILGSDTLKRRVIDTLGLKGIDPSLAARWNGADADGRRKLEAAALKELQRGLTVSTTPDSNVVRLDFKDRDPDAAALILNTLVKSYFAYRREVFSDAASPALEQEKAAFETRLVKADDAYEGFLKHNGVADFATEKASLAATYQSIFDEHVKAEVQLREVQGQLGALKAREGQAPQEIELQRDLDLSVPSDLLKLRAERQDLLSRYTPQSEPVRDIDAKIASLQALANSSQGVGEKDKRLGANPVFQGLETQRINLEAQLSAVTERRDELGRQLGELATRQMRLTGLESQYQDLSVQRDVLQANVKDFETKAEENRALRDLANASNDDIRVIEHAAPPVEAKSLRRVALMLAFVFALFTAICAGLLRVFTRRDFVLSRTTVRSLDMPVLATATMK
ncbi:MAG TPA: Wzz/FepE/Etk N-terminal domain-containing protein [Caulobacteraceae bacterium]|jgi:uncharacterized protein involved in exopolysaccharide biosynthesis|nr:Wzz/FepE/Etk N-terminal domain-containing protein [Caulobacteraceae bacterium]